MKILSVEINHCTHDLDESITHVLLNVELEDHTWRMVEVALPSAALLEQQKPPEMPEAT
jgi:hypothetical protein